MALDVTIRPAMVEDWPQVAGLLVELGRDVSPSAASNPSYVIRFGGHLALREARTLVAEGAEHRLSGSSTWSSASGSAIPDRRRG